MSRTTGLLSRLAFCSIALLAFAGSARAQITTFLGDDNPRGTFANSFPAQASFLGSFLVTGTENFDSYTPFTTPPLNFGGATGATATHNASFVVDDANIGLVFSVSPSTLLLNNFLADNVFDISRPVNGFGLFFVNAGDAIANQFTLELFSKQTQITKIISVNSSGNGTGTPTTFGPGRDQDSVFFFGVRDTDSFDIVTIKGLDNNGNDGILYDNVSIGFINAVPEPGTYALIGGLSAVIYGRYRYQKRKNSKDANKRIR